MPQTGVRTGVRSELNILVDDRPVRVAAGISVASALFNLGVTSYAQSVTGEPRAPLCGMGVCFECRVTIDSRPHQRACLIPVVEGMHVITASNPG
ncbi:MAG: (2Fe-2S)-binding protein [Gemmatimonadaceae bacterium]